MNKILFVGCFLAALHLSALSPLFRDGMKISFWGDSIVQHGTQEGGFIHLFMDGLKRSGIRNAAFVNEGIGGARSSTMLERLDHMLKKKPDLIVLHCGTNDVGWGKQGCTLPQYKENMGKILDRCAQEGIPVFLVTPTMHTEQAESKNNLLLKGYCEFLRETAKNRSLLLADWNARMHAVLKSKKIDGDRMLVLTVDKLHLNGYGNRYFAESMLAAAGVPEETIAQWEKEWDMLPAMTVMLNVWHKPQYKISIRDFQKLRAEAKKRKTTVDDLLKKAMNDYIQTLQ